MIMLKCSSKCYIVFANRTIAMIQRARRPKTLGSQVQTPPIPCSNQLIGSMCTYIVRRDTYNGTLPMRQT